MTSIATPERVHSDAQAAQRILAQYAENPKSRILVLTTSKRKKEAIRELIRARVEEEKWPAPTFASSASDSDTYDMVVFEEAGFSPRDVFEACLIPPLTDPEALAAIAAAKEQAKTAPPASSALDSETAGEATVMEEID